MNTTRKPVTFGVAISLLFLSVFTLSGCATIQRNPPNTGNPTPVETTTPVPESTEPPIQEGTLITSGRAELLVENILSLPFKKTSDDFVIGYFTDNKETLFELHVRGREPKFCSVGLSGKCKDAIGFVPRVTANRNNDREVYATHKGQPEETFEHLYCGEGLNFHHRTAVFNGVWIVRWSATRVQVETPAGIAWTWEHRVPGSIGFTDFVEGCPSALDPKRHTLCWISQSAIHQETPPEREPFNVTLLSFRPVGDQHIRTRCEQGIEAGRDPVKLPP